jgi:hypothetical protein
MSDYVFREGAVTTEIKVSESSYLDQDNKVPNITIKFSYVGTITQNQTADYLDANGNYIIQSGKLKTIEELASEPSTGRKIYKATLYAFPALIDGNINEVYSNISPEGIVQDVVESLGFTFVNELPSPSGITIPSVTFQDFKPSEIISTYMNVLTANWRIEGTNFIVYRNGVSTLTNVNINAFEGWTIPEGWKDDTTNQANKVIVKGANISQRTSETLTGTGTIFYTAYVPEDIQITGHTQTTDTIDGDYLVDKENKKITFESSQTNPVVTYTYNSQIRVEVGTGEIVKTITKTYLTTRDEARKLGREYLKIYKDGAQMGIWKNINFLNNNVLDFKRGYKINVLNIMNPDRDGAYVITKIKRDYPRSLDITVGEDVYNLFDWQNETKDRVKQLLQQSQNSAFVIKDIYQTGTIKAKITADVTSLFVVLDLGDVLFASDTTLASDADLISDTGLDADYALSYDNSAIPSGSKIVII